MEHYRDLERGLCDSYGSCAPVVAGLGGTPVDYEATRVYDGIEGRGAAFVGRPIGSLVDDDGKVGIVRDDLLCVPLPDSCAYSRVIDLYGSGGGGSDGSSSYVDFARAIQAGIHDDVHDTIGGMMPTFASPSDPLFWVWHSFIDLLLFMWEVCHVDHDIAQNIFSYARSSSSSDSFFDPFEAEYETCTFTNRGANMFPVTNITSEMYMRSNSTNDIRDDPLIGKYFRDVGLTFGEVASVRSLGENEFAYDDLTPPLWEDLLGDTTTTTGEGAKCPKGGWYTQSPTTSPVSTGPTVPRDLDAFGEWIASLRSDLEEFYPGDPQRVQGWIMFVQCQNSDRIVPDNEELYREKIFEGTLNDGSCNFWKPASLDDGNDEDTIVVVDGGGDGNGTPITPKTIEIKWFIPNFDEEDAYPDRRVFVGDTVVFQWDGDHNVYIHPTLDCEKDGSVFVGDGGVVGGGGGGMKNATYTFGNDDIGKSVVFACDVQSHCRLGQIVRFMVKDRVGDDDNGGSGEEGHSHDASSSTDAGVVISEDDKDSSDGSDALRRFDSSGYCWIGSIAFFLIYNPIFDMR